MTRLCVTILATLILYLAYQTLVSEAVPTGNGAGGGGSGSKLMSAGDSADNLLSDENLSKLQTAWLKSTYNRRSPVGTAGNEGRALAAAASYPVLRRAAGPVAVGPNPALGYFADISLIDDEDIQKRFDDYGHMRFGKRGGEGDQFDDYGHMRFGRR